MQVEFTEPVLKKEIRNSLAVHDGPHVLAYLFTNCTSAVIHHNPLVSPEELKLLIKESLRRTFGQSI